tara:strand:- start:991 stop:1179 length:189 start_codon:yes stop_codon:yes gene_type:complete
MNRNQIIKSLRLIQQWLADGDVIEATLDLKHLLDTIDPDHKDEEMDQLFNDLAAAVRPDTNL